MPLDTWVSLVVILSALAAFYLGLRRELRHELSVEVGRLRAEIVDPRAELKQDSLSLRAELKGDIERLDNRVYALAAGLRPLVEQAERVAAQG